LTNGKDRCITVTKALPAFPVWARAVLFDDPLFLGRVQADLSDGSVGAASQFQNAAILELIKSHEIIKYSLRNSDLLPIASQISGKNLSMRFFAAIPNGQTAGAEVAALREVFVDAEWSPAPRPTVPSPVFVAGVIKDWADIRSQMNTTVSSEVSRTISQIQSSNRGGWSIGISYGGVLPGISLNFSFGQWSFSLSGSGPTGLLAVGYGGLTVPIHQFDLPHIAVPFSGPDLDNLPRIASPPPSLK
jgi:hypothetical protein